MIFDGIFLRTYSSKTIFVKHKYTETKFRLFKSQIFDIQTVLERAKGKELSSRQVLAGAGSTRFVKCQCKMSSRQIKYSRG